MTGLGKSGSKVVGRLRDDCRTFVARGVGACYPANPMSMPQDQVAVTKVSQN